ncbi:hypothetical protein [Peribacillus huizhouensis]|uniref:IS110 family transposase n=1 Tax=Peribacillus huizhouensis TaxID=1501239 RepID=A0ABR6CN68_9BACI|nr:hypothetical protein [Peribacillus huizhouensis]MBA9026489.1 hypothetical protein [Peribacillus huizhouensis]
MKHVVALDVSMGKSIIVIYNTNRPCEYEGELHHTRPSEEVLKENITPIIRFRRTNT